MPASSTSGSPSRVIYVSGAWVRSPPGRGRPGSRPSPGHSPVQMSWGRVPWNSPRSLVTRGQSVLELWPTMCETATWWHQVHQDRGRGQNWKPVSELLAAAALGGSLGAGEPRCLPPLPVTGRVPGCHAGMTYQGKESSPLCCPAPEWQVTGDKSPLQCPCQSGQDLGSLRRGGLGVSAHPPPSSPAAAGKMSPARHDS